MFGIEDFWIWSAYLLCILSAILCVVYGVINWNKGGDDAPSQEDVQWAEEEDKIGEEL
jgi:hypothetical protein